MGSNPSQGPILFFPRIFRILFFQKILKLLVAIFGTFFFKIAYISVISIQYTTTYSNRSMPARIWRYLFNMTICRAGICWWYFSSSSCSIVSSHKKKWRGMIEKKWGIRTHHSSRFSLGGCRPLQQQHPPLCHYGHFTETMTVKTQRFVTLKLCTTTRTRKRRVLNYSFFSGRN